MTLRKFLKLAVVTLAVALPFAAGMQVLQASDKDTSKLKDIRIVMKTSRGDIDLTLFPSKAPVTVTSFLNLAKQGKYDGITFHRVIKDFMVQGGDPSGTGTGGFGYNFEDECVPELIFNKPGYLAMANTGRPRSNGSQFFITHVPTPHLNGKHTIFGEVTKGQDVVDTIKQGDTIKSIKILDPVDELFAAKADRLAEFNAALK